MICLPDFKGDDFKDEDFKNSSWVNNINDFLFKLLPYYFKNNDTYKDQFGRGFLEKYMDLFGDELDMNVIPYVECIMNINDPNITQEKFIDTISESLGSPQRVYLNEIKFRNLLKYIIPMYKIKGKLAYLENLFYLIGLEIVITKIPQDGTFNYYDLDNSKYDSGGRYDLLRCLPCFYYDAEINPNSNGVLIDIGNAEVLEKLRAIIEYNHPINSKLINLNVL